MCNYVNEMGAQTLHAPLESLTKVMFQYHDVFGSQYNWLMNKSDPRCAIANFLRVFDFFDQEASDNCQFRFNMHASIVEVVGNVSEEDLSTLSDRILHVYAVLPSQPHRLSFVSGPNREWKPYYQEPELCSSVPIFHPDVSITSVGWDGKSASITVQKHFPGFVRLERVYRVRTHVNCFSMTPAGSNRFPSKPFLHMQSACGPSYSSSSTSSETACERGGIQMVPPRPRSHANCPLSVAQTRRPPIAQYDATHCWSRVVTSRRNANVRHEMNWGTSTASVSNGNTQSQMASTNRTSLTTETNERDDAFTFCQDVSSPVSPPSRKYPLVVRNSPGEDADATVPSLELRGGLDEPALVMARSQPLGIANKRERSDCGVPVWIRRSAYSNFSVHGLPCENWISKNEVDSGREMHIDNEIYSLGRPGSVAVLPSSSNRETLLYHVSTILPSVTSNYISTAQPERCP
jgi:hypothetical protein